MKKKSKRREGPLKLLSSRQIYKNPWIRVREDKVIHPDGKRGIFGVVEVNKGVTVVPIDRRGYCYLLKEYAYALGRTVIVSAGGGIDEGETPLQAAKRELLEEAGLESSRWFYLGKVHYFPGLLNAPEHLFLALEVRRKYYKSHKDDTILGEIRVPFSRAIKMVYDGKIYGAERGMAILLAHQYLKSKRHVFKKSRN